jgi:hypothetical protein
MRGGLFLLFSPPFLYISTHASVRRFDNERAFSVSPNLQCRCLELRRCSLLVQISPTVHTDSILGYRHISACLCAPPRLLPDLVLAISIVNDSSGHVNLVTDRHVDRPGPSEPTPTSALAIDQEPPLDSTDRFDGMG